MDEAKRHRTAVRVSETGLFDSKWVFLAGMVSLLGAIPLGIALLVPLPAWILLPALSLILTSTIFVYVRTYIFTRKKGVSRPRSAGAAFRVFFRWLYWILP